MDTTGRCPVCDRPARQPPRYPQALCDACSDRATDQRGRPVSLSNVDFSGGFVAHHRDDGTTCEQVSHDGRVLIDGAEFRAGEARFGGTVVQPLG
ncbi:MAG: hypothetical protein ACXWWL_02805 [Candidatus Limnocylindria bacterium]